MVKNMYRYKCVHREGKKDVNALEISFHPKIIPQGLKKRSNSLRIVRSPLEFSSIVTPV